jgi:hypothetical protein
MKQTALFFLLLMLIAMTDTLGGSPSPTAAQSGLLVYPYLGETTPTSVVISWATSSAGASQVRYSLNQSYGNVVGMAVWSITSQVAVGLLCTL